MRDIYETARQKNYPEIAPFIAPFMPPYDVYGIRDLVTLFSASASKAKMKSNGIDTATDLFWHRAQLTRRLL